ncbi:perforin-1-like [Sardina pilchardus]|uniref:perforin-1-like n=1 Tax=Sardina pilchardus TaxID=27697 RepID=UPI002E10ACA0
MEYLGVLCLLVSLLHLAPLQACRVGNKEECDRAPFVPSHSLVGEGFNVVTLQSKGAYVVDMQTYLTPTNTCTLCTNPLMGDQQQKLPLSVLDWRAFSTCSQSLSSSVFSSVSSLTESSTSSIENDWKVGMGLSGVANAQLAGSQSAESKFASHRQRVDKTSFTSHHLTCSHYRYRVPSAPPLSPEFQRHVDSLPHEYSINTAYLYQRFINTYGTHYIQQVNLGGRFKKVTSVRTCLSTLNKISATQVENCLRVGISVGLGLVDASTSSGSCRKVLNNQDSVTGYNLGFLNDITMVSGGDGWPGVFSMTRNDSDGFHRWLGSIKQNPEIVSYTLFPIHELVSNTTVRGHLQQEVRKYILDNGVAKKPNPQSCGWNRPNLSPDCCPLRTHRGRLRVSVLRAWGLKGDPVGRTEGYVRFWYDGHYRRTRWIKSNDNPVWNSHFDLGNVDTRAKLRIEAWDKDVKHDDRLGRCEFYLRPGSHHHTCWLKRGRFTFSYNLQCDPYLTGPTCNIYWPRP